MSPSSAPTARPRVSAAAILPAGVLSGALDITAAFLVYGLFGAKPIPLLQGIAAGLLGPRSFSGGLVTALLGLFFQFFIATSFAAVYALASRSISFLIRNPLLAGPLYGIAVYFFMNRIVVPLSAARQFPFSLRGMLIGVAIHIVCVGLPIALVTRYYASKS
jgi:hypothetical protein